MAGEQYCAVCGEDSGANAIRRGEYSLHQHVCELWDLTTRAGDMKPGDVISSFRFMNSYAPMLVVAAGGFDSSDWRTMTVRRCRWASPDAPAAGRVRLVADGEDTRRQFPRGDSMLRAMPALAERDFAVAHVPAAWLSEADGLLAAADLAATGMVSSRPRTRSRFGV